MNTFEIKKDTNPNEFYTVDLTHIKSLNKKSILIQSLETNGVIQATIIDGVDRKVNDTLITNKKFKIYNSTYIRIVFAYNEDIYNKEELDIPKILII